MNSRNWGVFYLIYFHSQYDLRENIDDILKSYL